MEEEREYDDRKGEKETAAPSENAAKIERERKGRWEGEKERERKRKRA